jgi:glycosyltransferase involved in cell wall biosynthesis
MSAPIIIATLLREQGETGVQAHFNAFRRAVEHAGTDVIVVTPFLQSKLIVFPLFGLRKLLEKLNTTAGVWWYRHWHYWALKTALTRILRMRHDAIIYAQCPLSAKAALLARTHSSQLVKMVVHFNISQAEEWTGKGLIRQYGGLYRSIELLDADVLPRLDGIVYVSRYSRSILEHRIPAIKHVPSTVIPNFVSDPGDRETSTVIGDIVNIGTLEPRKNQKYLLEIIAEAKRRGKHYTLTLIGGGPDRRRLESLAQELGISDQIVFNGFQPDAARSIPKYRLYAHSALMESFGIVLIEALAHGIPVLAPPVGGIPEVFDDNVEGRYWSLENVSDAADKLIFLLENVAGYERMSVAAKKRFLRDFETHAVARRLLTFLHMAAS